MVEILVKEKEQKEERELDGGRWVAAGVPRFSFTSVGIFPWQLS
jgi:hypothetical protein